MSGLPCGRAACAASRRVQPTKLTSRLRFSEGDLVRRLLWTFDQHTRLCRGLEKLGWLSHQRNAVQYHLRRHKVDQIYGAAAQRSARR